MSVSAVGRTQFGTQKTFKSSGGTGAISMASVANGAGRQSSKIDLGATIAALIALKAAIELAATPVSGQTIDFYWAPSSSGTAGTDNPANVTGSDGAYAGYSSNLAASVKQLIFIGSMNVTVQATSTVQAGFVATFRAPDRYGSLIVVNSSGAAFHSSDANVVFTLTPIEDTVEGS